ncbi:MAG: hypothetical protein RI897_3161, partial [Verrucomicrobiota bacterium]
PHIVVEFRGHGLWGVIAGDVGLEGEDDLDALEFADAAIAYEFGHAVVDGDGSVFGAGLEDLFSFADGLDEEFAFVDGERGLFALDVLTGLEGEHADQRVPVIGGGDHDRVDILAGEHVTEVLGRGAVLVEVLLIDDGFGFEQVVGVDIADDADLDVFEIHIPAEVPTDAVAAGSDEADIDPVTGGVGAEQGGGGEQGERDGGAAAQEGSAGKRFHERWGDIARAVELWQGGG